MTCRFKDSKKDNKKPKITCTVTFGASSGVKRASVSVSRGNRTYARGRSSARRGRVQVPLRGSLPPGRYRIIVRITDETGTTTASSSSLRVR